MKKISFVILALALSGCVNLDPTVEGKAVKIVENKPVGCEALGKIDTTGYNTNKEQANNVLRNKVVAKGGNTVRIEELKNWSYGGMVIGPNDFYGYIAYAYKCPTTK